MENIVQKAINCAQNCEIAFSKFITPNDAGVTGGHQSGFHIHKHSWPLFFDQEGLKGGNKDKIVKIKWQDDIETDSRFVYYGTGTRNEYRLTRFGKNFPFLTENNVGDLLVLCKVSDDYYKGFVLCTDGDIEDFFAALNISANTTNGIISRGEINSQEDILLKCYFDFISSLEVEFPTTKVMADKARQCYMSANNINDRVILQNPDREVLNWLDAEFQLFKRIENSRYSNFVNSPFESVDKLVIAANTILNRRKSRAGKSLELHLAEIFRRFNINFDSQAKTEGNKKPDFLFPDQDAYFNPSFNEQKLIMLAAKTTCKDRWRQILNEADRIRTKHLFTLQQGISTNQLNEMYKYDVCLVVPKPYLKNFPIEFRDRILTLDKFVNQIKAIQD